MVKRIHTIKGPIEIDSFRLILPYEHLFTDLRGPSVSDYAQGEPSAVAGVLESYLVEASAAGVTALVECSTVGVGRNLSILRSLAEITSIQIVAPTGVYRDAYIPESLREASEDDLAEIWTRELTEGIEGTSIRAGFVKLAMSDDGPTALEIRNLRAAVKASQHTGAVIGSHTIGGKGCQKGNGCPGRSWAGFALLHLDPRPNRARHFDAEGSRTPRRIHGARLRWSAFPVTDRITRDRHGPIEAGFVDHLLLSHDAGWYNPARPDGLPNEGFRGYTALAKDFIPAMLKHGISEEQVKFITVNNPANAFAF